MLMTDLGHLDESLDCFRQYELTEVPEVMKILVASVQRLKRLEIYL